MMWLTSALQSVKRSCDRRPRTHCNPFQTRRSFLPRLEVLEDRSVPSTLTVLNNLDKGAGSLRDAIGHAHDGDTIVFHQNVAHETITLTSGALVIKRSLDIEGPGASLLAVSGNDASRVFDISAGLSVTIAGLTITHGRGAGGAGILNVGSVLDLDNAILSYNESWNNGGAIYNRNGATLTVSGSTFIGNQHMAPKGLLAGGGGIYNQEGSTATVSDSTFVGNRAVGGDGGVINTGDWRNAIGGGEGGAIHNDGYCTVENSTFTGNQAIGGNGGSGGKGASFYVVGFGTGGAIFNHPFLSTVLVIDGCTFTGNEAIGGSNATGGASGQGLVGIASGGALLNLGAATVTNSTFENNHARGGDGNSGGSNSVIVGRGTGGAIANSGVFIAATLTVSNSTFIDNQAIGGLGAAGRNGGAALGGGLATLSAATTKVTGSTFDGNQAIGGAGGFSGSGGNGFGGGIYNDALATLEVRGSSITDNQASGGMAGAGGSAGSGVGGGLYLEAAGSVCLDYFTIAHLFGNHASTSDDEVFGDYTICE